MDEFLLIIEDVVVCLDLEDMMSNFIKCVLLVCGLFNFVINMYL